MKYLLLVLTFAFFFACKDSPKNPGNPAKNENYAVFSFSKEPPTMDMRDPENWCATSSGEAALISADPQNFNRRLFALGDVPLKVIVDYGNQSAAFMLHKKGNQVELYTSNNFPGCLSNMANFQISPEGISFHYNNKKEVNFDVLLQVLPNGMQIALDLSADAGFGLSVFRCDACK
ncbi:MAG: hypothetical protein ACKVT2_04100 [Saprospiraceae bacterium]